MNKPTIILMQILTCGLLAAPASAQFTPQATAIPGSVPEGISYQGRLEDGGLPVNASKQMVFRVYSALSGGVLLWTSPAQTVSVSMGLFNAPVPVPVTTLVGGGARYLEVQIDGTILSPRELLNSVPYALIAKSLEGTIDISTAGLAINANSTAPQPALFISSTSGSIGVSTSSPQSLLHLARPVGGNGNLLLEGNSVVTGAPKMFFVDTNGGAFAAAPMWQVNNAADLFQLGRAPTWGGAVSPFISVDNTGNAGFGATAPTQRVSLGDALSRVGTDTLDGTDNKALQLSGANASSTRGAYIQVNGNEFAGAGGDLALQTGGVAGAKATLNHNGVVAFTSESDGAVVDTLRLKSGNVGISTATPTEKLMVLGNIKSGDAGSAGTVYYQLLGHHDNAGGSGFRMQFDRTNEIFGIAREFSGFQAPSLVIKRADGNVGIGTTTPSALFQVAAGTLAVTSTGKIGIGTLTPAERLHVFTDNTTGLPDPFIQVEKTHPSSFSTRYLSKFGFNGIETILPAGTQSGMVLQVTGGNQPAGGGGISLKTNGTNTRMFVQQDGNVGIGTVNPTSTLHISTAIDANAGGQLTNSSAGTAAAARWVISSNNGNFSMEQLSAAYAGTGARSADSAVVYSAGTGSLNLAAASATAASAVKFYTNGDAAANERMRIDNLGNVGIGTGASTPADRLEVAGGNVRLTAVAGSAGSVKLFSALTVGAVTCTAQCGANTFCLAAWDSAGVASTCGTAAASNRCLCSGFGN